MDELRELTAEEQAEFKVEIRKVWNKEEKRFFPSIMTRRGKIYELDETTFTYDPITDLGLTEEEKALMNVPISRWGRAWQRFMTENYPAEVPRLQGRLLWELIPRKIDLEAQELTEKTRVEFQRKKPRPMTGDAIFWENELRTMTNEQIMTTLVNVRRTEL